MRVVIGRIGRAHGIRGDLVVDLRTDEPQLRFAPGSSVLCLLSGSERRLTVSKTRMHSGRFLVSFAEIADRTAAEQIHGGILELAVDPADLPAEDDSYYDRQLVGLTVVVDGRERGTVTEVLHLPGHDSLLLDLDGIKVQVPFVQELVPQVDLTAGTITVVERPGLLQPEDANEVQ